jgi:hypothetical protein
LTHPTGAAAIQCPSMKKAFEFPMRHTNTGNFHQIDHPGRCEHARFLLERSLLMNRKSLLVGIVAAGCLIAASMLMPSTANAQADPRVADSMASLKAMAAKLGAPKLEGREAVGGKDAPALFFGSTKINNNFDVVDAVSKEDGKGMTATFFVTSGGEYIRVSTSVPKPDGSGRAIGTILDPAGKAIAEIKQGKPFYGEVTILGAPYITGYEPMKDDGGNVVGIYYVGYKK